jgi:hypothetical protein
MLPHGPLEPEQNIHTLIICPELNRIMPEPTIALSASCDIVSAIAYTTYQCSFRYDRSAPPKLKLS